MTWRIDTNRHMRRHGRFESPEADSTEVAEALLNPTEVNVNLVALWFVWTPFVHVELCTVKYGMAVSKSI
jgi:hypothetical protein